MNKLREYGIHLDLLGITLIFVVLIIIVTSDAVQHSHFRALFR